MPESTNSPWIKAFVLLFAYTFAIPSQLNLNKLSKRQSRIISALKPRMLLKLGGSTWHNGPPNPLQCPPWHSGPIERHFSRPAQVRTPMTLPPTLFMRYPKTLLQQIKAHSHSKLSLGFGEEVPWGCTQSPWPRGRWWGQWCSELIPDSTSSAIVTQTLSTDVLAQDHPRWLLPQGALCSDTLSCPIYQQDWGKTSWWKYTSVVSTTLLIFQTSTSILK